MYEEELNFLLLVEDKNDISNERYLFTQKDCNKLEKRFKDLPLEYIKYLKEIGAGMVREQQYEIYSDPELHNKDDRFSWYKPLDFKDKDYLVIGHDFAGNLYALDIKYNYSPVLLDHECMEEFPFESTLKSFFREMMLLSSDGKDERVSI